VRESGRAPVLTRYKHRGDTERISASPHADRRKCTTIGICAHTVLIAQDRHNSRADALVFISMSLGKRDTEPEDGSVVVGRTRRPGRNRET
jgi:hypothetical protein